MAQSLETVGFHSWLEGRQLSPRTQNLYSARLRSFFRFVEELSSLETVLTDSALATFSIEAYKDLLVEQGASPNTINSSLTAIRAFFSYLRLAIDEVDRVELESAEPDVHSAAEQAGLINAVGKSESSRDRAMFFVLYYTAVRPSELVSLHISDVVSEGEQVFLLVGGSSARRIPLNRIVSRWLAQWLMERTLDAPVNRVSDYLFTNHRGQRLTTAGVNLLLKQLALSSGIQTNARRIRHTCLANLAEAGYSPQVVAAVAGFQRVESALRFCESSDSSIDLHGPLEAIQRKPDPLKHLCAKLDELHAKLCS